MSITDSKMISQATKGRVVKVRASPGFYETYVQIGTGRFAIGTSVYVDDHTKEPSAVGVWRGMWHDEFTAGEWENDSFWLTYRRIDGQEVSRKA